MLIGYARVSTTEQDTALQMDALRRAGVRQVYAEKTSSVGARPQLQIALAALRPGQTLVVWKLDRIARSLKDLLSILDGLKARGIALRSLTEPIDSSSAMGECMLQILGAFAQLERSMIRERAIAGQVAAYRRGVRWGGQLRVLSEDDKDTVHALYATGWWTIKTIALAFDVSIATVNRALRDRRNPELVHLRRMPVLASHLAAYHQ